MNTQQNTLSNYLVPAGGGTHAVTISGVFTAAAQLIDWRQYAIDNFPFQPQGVFVDNTAGIGPLTITILPLGYNVIVPAGSVIQAQFPAPNGQTAQITGNGQATLIFVDFPVLPNGNSTTIAGGTVNIGNTPNVNVPSTAGGNPYAVINSPVPGTNLYGVIAAGNTTVSVVGPAGSSLRRLSFNVAGASLAVAGLDSVNCTMNLVRLFFTEFYVPAAPAAGCNTIHYDFSSAPIPVAGNLTLTLTTALATGIVEMNALFG